MLFVVYSLSVVFLCQFFRVQIFEIFESLPLPLFFDFLFSVGSFRDLAHFITFPDKILEIVNIAIAVILFVLQFLDHFVRFLRYKIFGLVEIEGVANFFHSSAIVIDFSISKFIFLLPILN